MRIIIHQLRNLLRLHEGFQVNFLNRKANMVAHSLARHSLENPRNNIFRYTPLCIQHIIQMKKVLIFFCHKKRLSPQGRFLQIAFNI